MLRVSIEARAEPDASSWWFGAMKTKIK